MNRVQSIYPPVGFTRQGRRDNNEDYVVPAVGRATPADRLFVVCDGVGGAQRGELASLLAGETIMAYAKNHPTAAVDSSFVRAALLTVEEAFDRAIADETDSGLAGMSTTLTMLSLHEHGVTIAHIGDSRVYHVRDGQILHQTDDHSLVNELVRTGQISAEEAATHPRRNVITRAIQGSTNPTSATVYVTQDVAPDDYFFLCTDGVLECVSNDDLTRTLLHPAMNDRQKVEVMLDCCDEKARDNFSGYLIRVATTEPLSESLLTDDDVVPIVLPQVQPHQVVPQPVTAQPVMAQPEHHLPLLQEQMTPQPAVMPTPVLTQAPDPEPLINEPETAPEPAKPESFQFTMDDAEEARWREQENRTWIQRLFS